MATEAPKVTRDGTMEVTAKEGMAYLEKEKPDLAEQIKQQMKEDDKKAENGSGDAPAENGDSKVVRDNTMVQTTEEGKKFLEKEGGVNEDAKTRSQEKELNKPDNGHKESDNGQKEAPKRAAEGQTDEADDVKKQKVEENGADKKEEVAPQEEQKE